MNLSEVSDPVCLVQGWEFAHLLIAHSLIAHLLICSFAHFAQIK